MQNAPFKGIESMQNASPNNTKSQQFLYLKEILTKSQKKNGKDLIKESKCDKNKKVILSLEMLKNIKKKVNNFKRLAKS